MAQYLLDCRECGREFVSKNKRQRYCSYECRDTPKPVLNPNMHSDCVRHIATPPRANWRGWSNEEVAIIKEYAGKETSFQIAARLGRTSDQVKHMARRYGLQLRLCGERMAHAKYSDALVERARELHDSGKKPKQIAAELDVPYWAVCDFVYYKRGLGNTDYDYEAA